MSVLKVKKKKNNNKFDVFAPFLIKAHKKDLRSKKII